MRSSDVEGRSIRSDALYPALSGEWEVLVTRNEDHPRRPDQDFIRSWFGNGHVEALQHTNRAWRAELNELHGRSSHRKAPQIDTAKKGDELTAFTSPLRARKRLTRAQEEQLHKRKPLRAPV